MNQQIMEQIREKLDKETRLGKFDKYAAAMKDYVRRVLLELCEQSERFAQDVLAGDTFEDCMKAVAKNCGNAISDLEACRRAVKFYRKDAEIRFQMVLEDGPSKTPAPTEKGGGTLEVIDLTDYL